MEERLLKIIQQQQGLLIAFDEHIHTLYFVIYSLLLILLLYAAANLFFTYYVQIIDWFKKYL